MKKEKPGTQRERNQVKVEGLTFADINECFYLALMDSSPDDIAQITMDKWKETKEMNPNFVYKLNWDNIDPIAIRQNLDCWIERKMGIFPNIQPLNQLKN